MCFSLSQVVCASSLLTQSYGSSATLGSQFFVNSGPTTVGSSGIQEWMAIFVGGPNITERSTIRFNPSTIGVSLPGVFYDPQTLSLNPGSGLENEYAIVRLTGGQGETCTFTGGFWGQRTNPISRTSSDVHVLKNGVSIFDNTVNSFGQSNATPFNLTVTMNPGDTLDFAVGNGAIYNGSLGDATAVSWTCNCITVPEPSGVFLLGLTAIPTLRRRRKQSTIQ
jgi:hypothetical protein